MADRLVPIFVPKTCLEQTQNFPTFHNFLHTLTVGDSFARRTLHKDHGRMIDVATLADLAAVDTTSGVIAAYVSEIDAVYLFDSGGTATPDSWVVVAPDVGTGCWTLNADALTLPALGSGLSDTDNLIAAGNALAAYGKALRLRGETYTLAAQWAFPSVAALRVELDAMTELNSTIGPPIGSPVFAPLYCNPGAEDDSGTVVLANTPFSDQILIDVSVSAGEMIRIRNTATGSGFRGNRYTVVEAAPSDSDYIVTVDRPILNQFGEGDEVLVWTSRRAFGHRLIGNGAMLTGNGDRLIEFIGTEDCRIEGLLLRPTEATVCGSFDVNGHDNHWIDCEADGTGGIAEDGFWLETQENSTVTACRAHGMAAVSTGTGAGVRLLNCEHCSIEAQSYLNDYGVVVWGEGGTDLLGSRNIAVCGRYDSNAAQGIAIGIGSSSITVDATANYNLINLSIGASKAVLYSGDFSNALNTGLIGQGVGVSITGEATDVTGGVVDTSGCDTGIASASPSSSVLKHIHGASVAIPRACFVNSGNVVLHEVDYAPTTANASLVRANGPGRTNILAGSMAAGSGSVGVKLISTAIVTIGAVAMTAPAGTGVSVASGTTVYVARELNLSGMSIPFAGTGTVIQPTTGLYENVSASATTGSSVEVLKTYTLPMTALSTGFRLHIRAAGTFAANPNAKTVQLKFGGNTLLSLAGGNDEGWSIEGDVYVTSLTTQTFCARSSAGSDTQTDVGTLTVDVTAFPALAIAGQGAAADDIVCSILELETS